MQDSFPQFVVPASGRTLFQSGAANLNPWTEAKVEKNPDRGPLLILDGEKDHVVPWAIAHAHVQAGGGENLVTEIEKIPDRGALDYYRQWLAGGRGQTARLRRAILDTPGNDRVSVNFRERDNIGSLK